VDETEIDVILVQNLCGKLGNIKVWGQAIMLIEALFTTSVCLQTVTRVANISYLK